MTVLLECADRAEIREAMALGFVAGVMTNPTLLAGTGEVSLDALKPLCQIVPGQVFYQLTTHDLNAMLLEAQAAFSAGPSQVVLQVPATLDGLRVAARMSLEIQCALSPVFSPAQAWLGREAGARYVVVYLSQADRFLGDGVELVAAVAKAVAGSSTEIVVADIGTASGAVAAQSAGAQHLALRPALLREMARHPLSETVLADFALYCD